MNDRLRTTLFFSVMIIFVLLLTLTIVSFYFISQPNVPPIISIFVNYHVFFMFSVAIFGLLFGSLSHLLLNRRIDKNRDEMKETIEILLGLISSDEKKIINYLMKNKGGCTQYELTKLESMTKLKTHRALERLESKEVISKEKIGKINKVYLSKNFKI